MRMMASRPSRGLLPCAALPRVSNVDPGKALVTERNLQVGGFGYDRRVGRPLPHKRVRADACVLLVHHRRDDEPALFEATLRRGPRRVDHRGQSTLHILRPAAVETIVTDVGREGRVHAVDADGIHMPAEHEGPARRSSIEHADDIRPPGGNFLEAHTQADALHVPGDRRRNPRFACTARHERRIYRIDSDELAQEIDGRICAMLNFEC